MSNYINENLLSSEPLRKQRDAAKSLVTKWDRTGLLEGIDGEFEKSTMAQLLENQARQLISEASTTSPSAGSVGSGFKGDEEWSGVALPLVRRIFGSLAAQDFVSVQPMNLPSGLVFYLDFQHKNARMGFTANESVMGKTGPFSPSGSSAPFGEQGFYGAGRYGYTAATGSAIGIQFTTGSIASMSDINYDGDISGSGLYKITGSLGAADSDKLSVRAWSITGSTSVNVLDKALPQYTSIAGADGNGVVAEHAG